MRQNPWWGFRTYREVMHTQEPNDTAGKWLYCTWVEAETQPGYIGETSGSVTRTKSRPAYSRMRDYAYVVYSTIKDQVDSCFITVCKVESTYVRYDGKTVSAVDLIETYLICKFQPFGNYRQLKRTNAVDVVLDFEEVQRIKNPQAFAEGVRILVGLVQRLEERGWNRPEGWALPALIDDPNSVSA